MGKNRTPAVEDRMNAGADTLMRWAAPKIENMLAWAEKGAGESKARAKIAASQATHQMEDTVDKVTPQIQSGLAAAGTALAGAANRVVNNVDQARHQVQDDYLPAASSRLADLAGQANKGIHNAKVNPAIEDALIKLTGDKKAVKKLRKAGENYTKVAQKQLKRHGKQSSGGKGWLVAGIVAAAGAAAVAVWQLTKPVADPWKNPAPKPLTPTGQAPNPATTGAASSPVTAPKPAPVVGTPAAAPSAGVAGTAATPAPATSGGNAVVDTSEEKVQGAPAPKSAGQ